MPGFFFIKFESFGRGTFEEPIKETVLRIDIRENDLNNEDKKKLKAIFSQDTAIIIQCDNQNVSMPFNYKQENSIEELKKVFPDPDPNKILSQITDEQFFRTYNQNGHSLTLRTGEPTNEFKISITDDEYKQLVKVLNTTYMTSGHKYIIIGVKTTDKVGFTVEKSEFTFAKLEIDRECKLITNTRTIQRFIGRKLGIGGKTKKRRYRKSKKIYKGKRKSRKHHKQK
jgi:hypothetical protein